MTEPAPSNSLGSESPEPLKPSSVLELQPSLSDLVWQANPLSISRYQLGEIEQKLLLYCIAMIDGGHREFSTYRIHVAAYAEACGIGATVIYNQLKEAAKTIKDTPLMIAGHRSAKDGKLVDLYTSWFVEVECGSGYIDVMFAPSLRPYLLGVKTEFYKFELGIPLHLSGEYTIRIYQLCKRWKFAGSSGKITVSELRMLLGLTVLDGKGAVVKERLPKYGDAKKWAIFPALAELARSSDVIVTMKEFKKPGSKLVESVEFVIRHNPAYKPDESVPRLLPGAKVAAPVDPAVAAMRETLLTEFALSPEQARMVLGKHPVAFIEEKAAIVRSRPCDNMAAVLLSALVNNYQPAKANKPAKPGKKAAPAPAPEPVLPPMTEEEKAKAQAAWAEWKKKSGKPENALRLNASAPKPAKAQYVPPTAEELAAHAQRKASAQAQLNLLDATDSTPPPVLYVAGMNGK